MSQICNFAVISKPPSIAAVSNAEFSPFRQTDPVDEIDHRLLLPAALGDHFSEVLFEVVPAFQHVGNQWGMLDVPIKR